jgi:hypothetical protein
MSDTSFGKAYLDDVAFSFRKHKDSAEQAIGQLDDAELFTTPGASSNSVAIIVKHVAGNLKSRWTDFLTSDGDKPWRDRDNEFIIGPQDSREQLLAAWEQGWQVLFGTLASLSEQDLLKTVTIRREEHTVLQAINRSLGHVAYHTGQILYISRLVHQGEWRYLTIPPGQSERARAEGGKYRK